MSYWCGLPFRVTHCYDILLRISLFTQIAEVTSMHVEEYDTTLLVKNDNVGQKLLQHVTPNGNPH